VRFASEPRNLIEGCSLALCFGPLINWTSRRKSMNGVIYIVGLIVVVMFILSFIGLR